ncbi:MAG: hypothetical protein IKO99_03395 [Bacteroidales bacterium]|nr:hypothetical protein [Bacteroidales bacterium]
MKEQIQKVVSTPTRKKYVKPDFEVIDLEDTPKLLAASGPNTGATLGASNYQSW